MPDLFTTGANWLSAQLCKAAAVRSITLTNPFTTPTLSITLSATPAATEREKVGVDGIVIRAESRDWIVEAADLVDGAANPIRPDRGWIITDSLDGERYELIAPDDSPWKWSDTGKRRIRIYSKSLNTDG